MLIVFLEEAATKTKPDFKIRRPSVRIGEGQKQGVVSRVF
jgi:hypothetical protein